MENDLVGLEGRLAVHRAMFHGEDMDIVTMKALCDVVVGVEPFAN